MDSVGHLVNLFIGEDLRGLRLSKLLKNLERWALVCDRGQSGCLALGLVTSSVGLRFAGCARLDPEVGADKGSDLAFPGGSSMRSAHPRL